MADAEYDPFAAGPHPVDVRTIVATDQAGGRLFPIELWSPAQSGLRPLIVFSHYSGGHRRTATYLCTHWPVMDMSSPRWITQRSWHRNSRPEPAKRLRRGRGGSTPSSGAAYPTFSFSLTICSVVRPVWSSTSRESDLSATASAGGRCWPRPRSTHVCDRWSRWRRAGARTRNRASFL